MEQISLKALLATLMILALALPDCDAQRTPSYPGPWKQAHATFYLGDSKTYGETCGFKDVVKQGYGFNTAALSASLFNNGRTCGACFEIKCINAPQGCFSAKRSIFVTATNVCPLNYNKSSNNRRLCNLPLEHFFLSYYAYGQIAKHKGGIVPVAYLRFPCLKRGGIRFTINGDPSFNLISVWNVMGAGEVVSLQVKGHNKLQWTTLKRNWGKNWQTTAMLVGESLTFKIQTSDGQVLTSWNVAPKYWKFGQTFEGINFH